MPTTATPGPIPGPPSDLTSTAVWGNTVTLSWLPPLHSVEATGYVLEGGYLSGQVLASIPTGSAFPTFTFATVPPGTYRSRG